MPPIIHVEEASGEVAMEASGSITMKDQAGPSSGLYVEYAMRRIYKKASTNKIRANPAELKEGGEGDKTDDDMPVLKVLSDSDSDTHFDSDLSEDEGDIEVPEGCADEVIQRLFAEAAAKRDLAKQESSVEIQGWIAKLALLPADQHAQACYDLADKVKELTHQEVLSEQSDLYLAGQVIIALHQQQEADKIREQEAPSRHAKKRARMSQKKSHRRAFRGTLSAAYMVLRILIKTPKEQVPMAINGYLQKTYAKMANEVAKQKVDFDSGDLTKTVKDILRSLHSYDQATEPEGAAPKHDHAQGDISYKVHRCDKWALTRLVDLFEEGFCSGVQVDQPIPRGKCEHLDGYNEGDRAGHEEPKEADSPAASSVDSTPPGPRAYAHLDMRQLDTASMKTSPTTATYACFICNDPGHSSGWCRTAGTIFDDCARRLVKEQTMQGGNPKAPKITMAEWLKDEALNDFDCFKETGEEYYRRCNAMPKGKGHVLDADFILAIVRFSNRLGLMTPESWEEFAAAFFGPDHLPIGGDTPSVRKMLGAKLHEFLTNAWSKGTVGKLGTHYFNHQAEGKKENFQAMAQYCLDTYGTPKGTFFTDTGVIGFAGKFPLCDFPYPKDGVSWDVPNTRDLMIRLGATHQAGIGHYTIHHKIMMTYLGTYIIAHGLPIKATFRLSIHGQDNHLYTLRIDIGYTVVQPVLRAYFAIPRNADGTHNPYGLHNSVESYSDLTYGLADLLYRHPRIQEYLEEQLLGTLTNESLATLRFSKMDLTGTDGCPLAFNDSSWGSAIRKISKGLGEIYYEIVSDNPGLAHFKESATKTKRGPQAHLATQHIMLHLHQDKIYGATDADVDLLSDVLLQILKQPGYDHAFADPTWDAEDPNKVNVTTTVTGEGCLFPL
jgi:hypothetical protein